MKRITERTLIEFDNDDHIAIERMYNKASVLYEELSRISRVFFVGDFDPKTNEWRMVPVKHPIMSRTLLLEKLKKVSEKANQLAADAYDFRTKVLDS